MRFVSTCLVVMILCSRYICNWSTNVVIHGVLNGLYADGLCATKMTKGCWRCCYYNSGAVDEGIGPTCSVVVYDDVCWECSYDVAVTVVFSLRRSSCISLLFLCLNLSLLVDQLHKWVLATPTLNFILLYWSELLFTFHNIFTWK